MTSAVPGERPRVSARLRLTLGYAAFLVLAGAVTLAGVYVTLRYVPDYPLTAANPRDSTGPVASRGEILDTLLTLSGYILGVLAVVGLAGGWVLAGRVLRPLQEINRAARVAASGKLDHRIGLTGRNDEFQQLADTFDDMLARLQDAFEAQQRFAANASHELRTPLAVTATLLDVARVNPDATDHVKLVERLRITNDRAVRLTDALLRLADMTAGSAQAATRPVDLADLARRCVAEHQDEARRLDVTVVEALQPAVTCGDPVLLEQLVINLIQNALRHNARPGSMHISTAHTSTAPESTHAGMVTLRTENPGPTYSPETTAQLCEPFLRGTGRFAVTGRASGHGLGLAIVRQILDVHGGTLSLRPRAGGGLVVTATMRAAVGESSRPAPYTNRSVVR